MANWIYAGTDSDGVMAFFDIESSVIVNVDESANYIRVVTGNGDGHVKAHAYTQFMFKSGLGDVVRKTKMRSNAENILAEVLDAIGRLSEITHESVLNAMSPLEELNTPDPYYNDYIKNTLGDNHLYQSQERLYKGVEWVWTPQRIAGGMRVALKCYDD